MSGVMLVEVSFVEWFCGVLPFSSLLVDVLSCVKAASNTSVRACKPMAAVVTVLVCVNKLANITRCMDALMHGCIDAWMHRCMGALMHGCMDA